MKITNCEVFGFRAALRAARNPMDSWSKSDSFSRVELLRHALGADSPTPGYRNHFAATPGSDDDRCWATMVLEGLALLVREPCDLYSYNIYAATEAGRKLVGLL